MGLDTSHNCWHGSYSTFGAFRDAVAIAAKDQYGYEPDYTAHPIRCYYGWWDADHPYADVLDVFFVHSDCEGYIFPVDAERLADRLKPLRQHVGEWKDRLQAFIDGLESAADEWEIVEFR